MSFSNDKNTRLAKNEDEYEILTLLKNLFLVKR